MYDEHGICWHASGWDVCCRIEHRKLGDKVLYYGRCKSGRRWFWTAYDLRVRARADTDLAGGTHGWEGTEQAALDAARAAIVRLADRHKAFAVFRAGLAYYDLKKINAARRAARPPSGRKHSQSVEYLYGWGSRFTILKKTAKRIYYSKRGECLDERGEPTGETYHVGRYGSDRAGFIDRQEFERPETPNDDRRYYYASYPAYAAKWRRYDWTEIKPDLAKLKAAMAAAHPDRGGSSEQFIAARKIYVDARRSARS